LAFSDDAIGFYLQLEDQLTPALATAESSYGSFVKSLERYNQRAFKSANMGMQAIADLVESFDSVPQAAAKAYDKAYSEIKKRTKPITQSVRIDFSPKTTKGLALAVEQGVAKAMRKVNIRLTAARPLSRVTGFDTTESLRAAYKAMTQPPDMRGGFQNIPRFAEGGEVTGGGKKDIDNILAMLKEGEIVLPVDIADALKAATGKKRPPAWLSEALAEMLNEKVAPMLEKNTQQLEEFNDAGTESIGIFEKLFTDILGQARFLALNKALENIQNSFQGVQSAGGDVADQMGATTDASSGLVETMFEANRVLGLTRSEMFALTSEAVKYNLAVTKGAVGTDELAQGFLSLTQAGLKNQEQLIALAPAVALIAKTTFTDPDSAAKSLYKLTNAYGLSNDAAVAYFATLQNFKGIVAVDAAELNEQMQNHLETVGAFFSAKNLKPEEIKNSLEGLAMMTASLSENWGDAGSSMADTMAQALAGNIEARQTLGMMGLQYEELERAVVTGNMTPALGAIVDHLQMVGGEAGNMAILQERLNFPGTAEELGKIVTSGSDMLATMRRLQEQSVPTGKGFETVNKQGAEMTSMFDRWKNSVSGWFSQGFGLRLIEFFDGFNFQLAHSIAYLAKDAVAFTIWAGKGIASLFGMTAARSAHAAAASTEAVAVGASAAASTVAAPASVGLSAGLLALAPAVPVILALAGAVVAVGAALWLATPAFEVFSKVAEMGIRGFLEMFTLLMTTPPGQILAAVGALYAMAGVFPLLGIGILTFSGALAWAAPGLLVFAGAIAVLGEATGSAAGLHEVLSRLMSIFIFEPGMVDEALAGMEAAVTFVRGYVTIMGALTALAAGAVVASITGAVLEFFGVGSPLESLVARGRGVLGTLKPLMAEFAELGFGATKVEVSPGSLQQITGRPILNVGDIEEAILVRLDPESTDVQVRDAVIAGNALLASIAAALQYGTGVGETKRLTGTLRPTEKTRQIARGGA
jgi:hypothetical protein